MRARASDDLLKIPLMFFRLVETSVEASTIARVCFWKNPTDRALSLERSIVQIGQERTELRGENEMQIAACRHQQCVPCVARS